MNESETRAEHIDLALKAAGWGVVEGSRILREYHITPSQVPVQNGANLRWIWDGFCGRRIFSPRNRRGSSD
jgi:type I site-specific restriction endonuclease